jgi:hypothetical protein
MKEGKKEEKKQVGETERTRKKKLGTTHNTQKNEDFLLENDPAGWTKTRIYQTAPLNFFSVWLGVFFFRDREREARDTNAIIVG